MDAMESVVAVVRIDRKSSIESEPRTLGVNQIQFAREAAEYVANTRSTDEASTIFIAGMHLLEKFPDGTVLVTQGIEAGDVRWTAANADTVMDPNEEYFGHGESKLQWPEHKDGLSAPFYGV